MPVKGPKVKISSVRIRGTSSSGQTSGKAIGQQLTARVERGVRKLREPLRETFEAVYAELQRKHGTDWRPSGLFGSRSATRLRRRTGRGLRSIRDSISIKYDGRGGVVGRITAGEMAIHETGGSVTPTSADYLAIPTVYALSSRGTPLRDSPRDWPRSFIRRSNKNNLFIFRRVGRGRRATIEPLYLLKRRVKIPARLGLRDAVRKREGYFRSKAMAAVVRGVQ